MSDPAEKDLSEAAQHALDAVKGLPADERRRVLTRLYESEREVDAADGLHPAWRDELQKRLDTLADGNAVTHDLDEVEAELLATANGAPDRHLWMHSDAKRTQGTREGGPVAYVELPLW